MNKPFAVDPPARADTYPTTASAGSRTGPAHGLHARAALVTLIGDRAEAVTTRTITTHLEFLLRCAAPGLRLVIVGRGAVLIPLYRYQLAGELSEILTDDLALTPDETAEIV